MHLQVLPPVPPEQAQDEHLEIERSKKRLALSAEPSPRRYVPERDGWWDGYSLEIDPDFPELAARVASTELQRSAHDEQMERSVG